MRSEGFRAFLIVLVFLAIPANVPALSAEESSAVAQSLNDLGGIKLRLASLEKSQEETLATKDNILQEIDRLRVWVRHGGGNPKV